MEGMEDMEAWNVFLIPVSNIQNANSVETGIEIVFIRNIEKPSIGSIGSTLYIESA